MHRTGNYEISKKEAMKVFLKYDQQELIDKFSLEHDEQYLYGTLIGRRCRIDRRTALVETGRDDFQTVREANFEEALSLFDLICYGNTDICPLGEWALINSLPGKPRTVGVDTDYLKKYADIFARNESGFRKACEALGGKSVKFGDSGYEIPIFRKLSVIVQFYAADEDFPAQLTVLWDKNSLRYLRYETTFYIVNLLMARIMEEIEI